MDERLKVLVVGDLMIDEYIWCEVHRLSAEAPIPIADFECREWVLGGAGNVARNLLDMFKKDIRVGILGLRAEDEPGKALESAFASINVDTEFTIIRPAGNTTLKTRIMAQDTQLCRVDRDMQLSQIHRFEVPVLEIPFLPDALIVSDYNKGVLRWLDEYGEQSEQWIRLRASAIRVVDIKSENINIYRRLNPNYLTVNTRELVDGLSVEGLWSTFPDLKAVFETRGERGVRVWWSASEISDIRAQPVNAVDVTGAGDTFVAALTWGLLNGQDPLVAAQFGNRMASMVVQKIGTRTVGD